MNRIVRDKYPVSALPDDLRDGLNPAGFVRVVIDESKNDVPRREDLIAMLEAARRLPKTRAANSVERIRALRDEWDD